MTPFIVSLVLMLLSLFSMIASVALIQGANQGRKALFAAAIGYVSGVLSVVSLVWGVVCLLLKHFG